MKIFVPKEKLEGETRIAMVPDVVKKLATLGADLTVESGVGSSLGITDAAFKEAGASVGSILAEADMVLRLNPPTDADISGMKKGAILISYLDPFNQGALLKSLAAASVSAISMEMVPRTTIAQKMDALSSQANLAGYVAVVLAAERMKKILPMMMTPAGTIAPAKVFIVGVGVAGLQAIATAKRLGARVEAFDTRPVVEEQVKSLGAKFVKIDLGETGQTDGGYAKALTDEQIQKQREGMAKICAQSDVVITTAQVFGRKAPTIITTDMVKGMKPGSVVVDCATDNGGNVECSELDKEVDVNGVNVIGYGNLPRQVPVNASQMYASNLFNMIDHFWDKEAKTFNLNRDDEIIQGALITHDGEIVNERVRQEA